jgi:hypothetical protein
MGHENGGWMNDDQRGAMREAARVAAKHSLSWRLGFNQASDAHRRGKACNPESYVLSIVNTFSDPEMQMPQFVAGAKAFAASQVPQ